MYTRTPRYGNRITPITQAALPQPDTSWRWNRSLKTDIANQNQITNANTVSTSIRKFAKLKPPPKSMFGLPNSLPETYRTVGRSHTVTLDSRIVRKQGELPLHSPSRYKVPAVVIENHDIVFRSVQTLCAKPSCLV